MVKIVSFGNTSEKYEMYASRGIEKQIKAGNMTPRDGELIHEWVVLMHIILALLSTCIKQN